MSLFQSEESRSRHRENALHIVQAAAHVRIPWIGHGYSVHNKEIAVNARLHGSQSQRPHAVISLRERRSGVHKLLELASNEHGLRLRGVDAESNLPIGRDLRRNQRSVWIRWPLRRRSWRGLAGRCGCHRSRSLRTGLARRNRSHRQQKNRSHDQIRSRFHGETLLIVQLFQLLILAMG